MTTENHSSNTSDYGDFGEDTEEIQILDELLAKAEEESRVVTLRVTDIEDYEHPQGLLLPVSVEITTSQILRDNIENSDPNREKSREREVGTKPIDESDTRSPLEKFRKPPKKALSVTDLVSPAWCELQYFYTLSKHGRKRRTPAMKQGSAVHKALEDEVHITVPVETTKTEDGWGLRIWNICQGLKTLRETGRTRELEIWGIIGGEVVNGIIDEVSYDCPDPQAQSFEASSRMMTELPEYQTSITEYLLAKPERSEKNVDKAQQEKWIYISDVKTRATPTLPTGSSLRPTIVQLHLYHHMLENLAQGNFTLNHLAERYGLDIDETFSDSFLAQLSNLNQEMFSSQESTGSNEVPRSQDSMDILLQNNTLSTLWQFMLEQFRKTFIIEEAPKNPRAGTETLLPPASQQSTSDLPPPPSQPTRLSPLLSVSYFAANYKHSASATGQQRLGHKSFQFNPAFLHSYLSESLSWWRGEREARGVILQEAWKCRNCDFRNDCAWIHERDQEAFNEALERKKMREMAGVEGKDTKGITRSNV